MKNCLIQPKASNLWLILFSKVNTIAIVWLKTLECVQTSRCLKHEVVHLLKEPSTVYYSTHIAIFCFAPFEIRLDVF